MALFPIKTFLIRHGWWMAAGAVGLMYGVASGWLVWLTAAACVALVIEVSIPLLYLQGRGRTVRWVTCSTLAIVVLLFGGTLLFLERAMFRVPLLLAVVFLLGFFHYTLRSAHMHAETDI